MDTDALPESFQRKRKVVEIHGSSMESAWPLGKSEGHSTQKEIPDSVGIADAGHIRAEGVKGDPLILLVKENLTHSAVKRFATGYDESGKELAIDRYRTSRKLQIIASP